MSECLDTGRIQAFLDGELTPSDAGTVSAHIALCDACAAQLATAEEETALVFSVLERELETLVPTQRLWSKINDSIEVEKQRAPFWKKIWAAVTLSIANPSLTAAAAMIVVLAVVATVLIERNSGDGSEVVSQVVPVGTGAPRQAALPTSAAPQVRSDAVENAPVDLQKPTVSAASFNRPGRSVKRNVSVPVTATQPALYIPGEESYVKTIATLSQTVEGQKDSVLRPSERVSYERDMAVVDDAIKKMRAEVRRNPKNESAKQVLYTSYQNKIDLLNSVSQREELVASLKD